MFVFLHRLIFVTTELYYHVLDFKVYGICSARAKYTTHSINQMWKMILLGFFFAH